MTSARLQSRRSENSLSRFITAMTYIAWPFRMFS